MQPIDLFNAAERHAPLIIPANPQDRRRVREAAGVSQELLAEAVGCSVTALVRWETRQALPRKANHRDRYSRTLGALEDYATLLRTASARAVVGA